MQRLPTTVLAMLSTVKYSTGLLTCPFQKAIGPRRIETMPCMGARDEEGPFSVSGSDVNGALQIRMTDSQQ